MREEFRLKSIKVWLGVVSTALVLSGCGQPPDSIDQNGGDPSKVIYGDDNRLDLYQVQDASLRALADSTVALMEAATLQDQGGGITKILGKNYRTSQGLCTSEPFGEQDLAAFCSGSLVAKDMIMTAGHCIRTASDCSNVRFVFGFALKAAGAHPKEVSSSEVYRCTSIVATQVEGAGADFALVKLDRPVNNHAVLEINRGAVPAVGADLTVIGHPVGLPTKVAGGAKVRSVQAGFLVANLDTYGGNSGSAVFNSASKKIEGILVRGENDFVSQGGCMVSQKCTDSGCRGEDVTLIKELSSLIPVTSPLPTPSEPPPPPPPTVAKFTANPNLAIPDNKPAGVSSVVTADQVPGARKVYVEVNIEHTYIGDLILTLQAPDGKTVVLSRRKGGSADDIIGTYGKNLTAEGALASLSSVAVSGNWKLTISDNAARDIGRVKSWSLIFDK